MRDNISQVYVLFSNHLDIGYTANRAGSSSGAVVDDYFNIHIPKAIATANHARERGGVPYKWMTHSWLVSAYRNCNSTKINRQGPAFPSDVTCPSDAALAVFEAAVRRGDISWHAFPFNGEPELFTPELFDAALNLTFEQDALSHHAPRRTLSLRDVPGLTRNSVPLLAKRGISAISVGENSQVAPSALPPIFVWEDERSRTSVIALFHALGYGGAWPSRRRLGARAQGLGGVAAAVRDGKQSDRRFYQDSNGVLVMTDEADPFDDGPGLRLLDGQVLGGGSQSESCVPVAPAGVALCLAWRPDNTGPHGYFESQLLFDKVRLLFPNADVKASDGFDDFVAAITPYKKSLPVIKAEIGDTWVMGATADPLKVALYRAASRAHARCTQRASCVADSGGAAALRAFERLLMVAGEHTWGWNGGHIRSKSWSNEELRASLESDEQFQTAVVGWKEQRAILRNAVAALPPAAPLAQRIVAAFAEIEGGKTPFDGRGLADLDRSSLCRCGEYDVGFGADGSITSLRQRASGLELASAAHPLARLWYHGMGHAYFKRFAREYVAGISAILPELAAENLYKPNLRLEPLSANASLTRLRASPASSGSGAAGSQDILLDMRFPARLHGERGAPATAQALLRCEASTISYTLRWFNKTATHAPETIWLSNQPIGLTDAAGAVTLDKLGSPIDALDADLGCDGKQRLTCGVHLHGVGDGGVLLRLRTDRTTAMRLAPVDSALVSVGTADPVPTPLARPDPTHGIHFGLVGNIWNTNYPFWYPFVPEDAASQFRFKFELP